MQTQKGFSRRHLCYYREVSRSVFRHQYKDQKAFSSNYVDMDPFAVHVLYVVAPRYWHK